MRGALPLALVLLSSSACMDTSRVNSTCTWTEKSVDRLDLSTSTGREHLRADVALAGELGVRYADDRARLRPSWDSVQQRCNSFMMATIAQRHGVAPSTVKEAVTDRVWWADGLVVYVPLGVIVALTMDALTRRICRAFDPEDRTVAGAAVAFFALITALIGLGLGQFWGPTVEEFLFLRTNHLSYRMFQVPIVRHGWIGYFTLLAFCTLVAIVRFRRTPVKRVERSYGDYLRPVASRSRAVGGAVAQRRAAE